MKFVKGLLVVSILSIMGVGVFGFYEVKACDRVEFGKWYTIKDGFFKGIKGVARNKPRNGKVILDLNGGGHSNIECSLLEEVK